MKAKRRKLKKSVKKFLYLVITVIILIILVIIIMNNIKYHNSNEYKLKKLNYNSEQIELIETLDQKYIDNILTRKYNKTIVDFIKQKYFIYDYLDEYLEYYEKHKDYKLKEVVSIVNVRSNYEPYDEDIIEKTDVSKNNLMLVNKYNYLDETYSPNDIKDISTKYAYDNNQMREEAYEQFKKMWNDARLEDLTLIVGSSYREYKYQEDLWYSRAYAYGEEVADSGTARAGFSEHQTGLALDIVTYNTDINEFENSDEFKWLQKNGYKYGFILRYPKGKENITGYEYESWHYRYVGKEAAKVIQEENITFDEYYAYYVRNH